MLSVVEQHKRLTGLMRINVSLRADPSMTGGLRRRFMNQMDKRFNDLKRIIRKSIITNDCFGIQPDVPRTLTPATSPTPKKAFEFLTTRKKVSEFMSWLEGQENLNVLEIVRRPGSIPGIESYWSDVYIDSAYQRGIRSAGANLRSAGYSVTGIDTIPGGISAIMGGPVHADRVGVIYSRTYEELKSVTQFMNGQIRQQITDGLTTGLARGIAEGKNPRVIARELYKDVANRVDKIGKVRARMIARTEVMNANNTAMMAEYERAEQQLGEPLYLDVSLGANPCEICIDLEAGGPYLREMAMGQLPAHPNCVCVHVPVVKSKKK